MTGRKKFVISLFTITLIFLLFILSQWVRSYFFATPRTADSLLNQYYRLNRSDPEAAKKALDIILKQYPNNARAIRELGHWYLMQGDVRSAIQQFQYAAKKYPDDAYVNMMLKQLDTNMNLNAFNKQVIASNQPEPIHQEPIIQWPTPEKMTTQPEEKMCSTTIQAINDAIPDTTASVKVSNVSTTVSERDALLNAFYQAKNNHESEQAWVAMNKLLQLYPNDVLALKEAGYYALSEKKTLESVGYFKRAYVASRDPYLALQVGYLLDGLNKKAEAYQYFDWATKAKDPIERMKAEIAKTNLRGMQTKFMPDPYYADLLFYPFYRSRFKLMIYPLIAHVGFVVNKEYNVRFYLSYRRTTDNRSTGSGQLPQIFEDNASIKSLGVQAYPFKTIPLSTFIEVGKSEDLVYENRSRWRNDVRGGLVYYNEWGKEARYTFNPRFTLKPNMDVYADLIYFSRYKNTIATMRARPGVEVFRYGSSSVNLYFKAFLSEDYDRLYYNNILEVGPSIAFTPSDRYNITIRYECLRGYYLPSGGDEVNPYSSPYHNNMIFLDTYMSV